MRTVISHQSLVGSMIRAAEQQRNRSNVFLRKLICSAIKTAALLIFCAAALFVGQASAELTIEANHDHITIDFFYHGSTVSVKGLCDPDVDLIVKIASPDRHQSLKKKGKAAGFLWMNVGTLNFAHTPDLYAVYSTKKIEDILSEDEMNKHVLGYPALLKHADISPAESEDKKARWFNEFAKFKEHESLYAVSSGDISISNEKGAGRYALHTAWPYQAYPGTYTVTVYAVKNKRVVETTQTEVFVEQVGIVKYLSNMAKNKGALYGIISIIAALGAGFGVGIIFRKGGGAH